MVKRLTKAELEREAEHIPISSLLGKGPASQLTPKQKAFARKVASGKSKAQAYREAYNPNPAPTTIVTTPYKIAADPRVRQEIEALELAERTAAYRTPARLREHVIKSLLEVTLDPETKAAVRVQALKVLGSVTEVAAFTDRKEVRTVSTSETARAKVLEEIKSLMGANDEVVDVQAKSLLDELAAVNGLQPDDDDETVNGLHPAGSPDTPTDQDAVQDGGTPGGYERTQVIDSIEGEADGGAGSAGKRGVLPPDQG